MNPDRLALLEAARAARETGNYAAALRLHQQFQQSAQAENLGSFWFSMYALREWQALGQQYAPALLALREMRDHETALLLAGQAIAQRFADGAEARRFPLVAELNELLSDQRATCDTFLALRTAQPEEARIAFIRASTALVACGEFACAQSHLGEPLAAMRRQAGEINAVIASLGADESHPSFVRKMSEIMGFAGRLRLHEQVLEGLGDADAAARLRADALAALDSGATRRLVEQELAQPGAISALVAERETERDAQRPRASDATQ